MSEELRSKIVYETSEAVANINTLSAALNNYNSSVLGVAKSSKAIKKATTDTSKSLSDSAAEVDMSTYDMYMHTSKAAEKAAKNVKKSSNEMILSWKSVIRIFTIQVIHQGISKITSALAEGTQGAREYAKALAEIQTIGPRFRKDFAGLDEQIKAFSADTGFVLDETTAGMYQTLSNQVATAGDEFEFLGAAADLAIGGVTTLDGAVNLLSSSINSYGKSSAEAYDISGKMFKAVELGRFRIDDIANSYGRVLGLSAQLGISQAEVNAAMATLTASGMDANEAMTLITNTELKLAKPTKKLQGVFDDIGVSTAEAGIQAYGFQGFLEEIGKRGGTTATDMGKLFGRVRAVRGALGLTNTASERYVRNLKEIEGANAETIKSAKDLVYETDAKQLELEFNRASIAITEFGQTFNSAMLSVIRGAGGGEAAVGALTAAIIAGAGAFGVYKISASGAFSTVAASAATLRKALLFLSTTPIGLALSIGTLAATAVVAYSHMSNAAEKAAEKQRKALEEANKERLINLVETAKEEEKLVDDTLATVQKGLADRIIAEKDASEKTAIEQDVLFGNIKDQMDDRIAAVEDYFETIRKEAEKTQQEIFKLNQSIFGVEFEKEAFKFDRLQKRIDDSTREVYARQQKSTELRYKAVEAQRKGNKEEADFYQQRSMSEAKTALSVADQTKNRSLIARAEQEVERSFDNQVKLLETRKKQQLSIAKAAGEETSANAIHLKTLKAISKEAGERLKLTPDMTDAEKARVKKAATEYAGLFDQEIGKIKLSKIFKKVDVTLQLNIKEQIETATEGLFDPVTKQVTSFEKATIAAFDRISAAYKEIIPGDKKITEAAEALVGKGTAEEQSKRLVELQQEYNRGTKSLLDAESERNKLTKENFEIETNISKIRKSYETGVMARHQNVGLAAAIYGQTEKYKETEAWLNKIEETVKRVQEAQAKGQTTTKQYNADMAWLAKQQDVMPGVFGIGPQDIMSDTLKRLEETKKLQESIMEKQPEIEVREKIQERVEKADVIIKADDTQLQGTVSSAQSALNSLEDKTVKIYAEYVSQEATPAHFGRMFMASGGSARGHDRIPAMLEDGEFVVSAGASRKIFSQLVEANATYKYLGGPIPNTNINNNYNFNINGAASPQQTAREMQKLIRRENRIRK